MFRLSGNNKCFTVLSPEGGILYCSPGFDSLAAFDGAALVGTNIGEWLEPQKVSGTKPWYCLPVQDGIVLQSRSQGRLEYWLESGKGCTVLFVYKAKTALEIKLNKLYSRAFHLNPGLSAISVLETGEHLDVNQAWLNAMGYKRSEVIGKTAQQLNIWEKGYESRQKIVQELKEKGRITNHEFKMRTKDSHLLDILVSAELIEYQGRRLAFFASHDVTPIINEITRRKQTENDLIQKSKYLEQANLALKSMLDHRDTEKRAIEGNIFLNIKKYILPYLENIEKQNPKDEILVAVNIIKTSINQLMSPASENLFSKYTKFTPMEIKVADLVKQGMQTKEIAPFLNIAASSVSTYRNNIRTKLGLRNSKTNLRVYLNSLQS